MVIPDCSLVVTTFSRQSWLLQRIATKGKRKVTSLLREYPAVQVHAEFMPQLGVHYIAACRRRRRSKEGACGLSIGSSKRGQTLTLVDRFSQGDASPKCSCA